MRLISTAIAFDNFVYIDFYKMYIVKIKKGLVFYQMSIPLMIILKTYINKTFLKRSCILSDVNPFNDTFDVKYIAKTSGIVCFCRSTPLLLAGLQKERQFRLVTEKETGLMSV